MKQNITYIPRNLNIKLMLAKHPPKIKNFKVDRLILIISLLNSLPARSKKIADIAKENNGYVPLKAERLRREGLYNYNQYLKYLKERGIIESDDRFIKGKKVKWYRFTKKYREKVIMVISSSPKRNSKERFLSMHRLKKKYPNLKWFDMGGLEVNMPKATEYLESLYSQVEGRMKFNYAYISCAQIEGQDFYYTVDSTSQRVHTTLTGLKKELRQFVTFDGSRLVGVDVKNAQPFFGIVLLSMEFLKSDHKFSLSKIFSKEKGKEERQRAIAQIQKEGQQATITLLKSLEESERQSITEYIHLVSTGTVYEAYMLKYRELWGGVISRDKAKKRFIKQLFAQDNHYIKERETFIALFPVIYRIFMTLSCGHRNELAILLQRIESYLILEKVCWQISKERPDLPIFTIHDNVVTLLGHEGYVASVIKNILKEYIGFEPQVGIEVW